ncbi:baseplate J/gp47 family protein [Agathobaculum sp.]|uniref:baseplate J/gp47 family protein n=1 Tax=Agathobaculum sp. TaxID=2048138 RepID=UPI0027B9363E|nr:baseplate J/gp47 family protein [Agathobaculum sp.]
MSTASEILEQLLAAMPDSYQKTIGFPTYDLLAAVSLRMQGTDEEVAAARAMLDPENLTGDDLDRYIFPRSGLDRRQATFAHGVVHVTGTGTVSEGTLFESGGGVQFYATQTVQITGEGDVPVTCRQDGAAGNLPAHSVTQMPVTIQGIASCDNPAPMEGGYDEEDDAAYFDRFLLKLRTPATSGNIYHYMTWALEVSGVGKVKVFPLGHGDNTVDVVLVDSEGQPADSELVGEVQDYIDPDSTGEGYGQAPIGARCYVSAATEKAIALSCTVSKLDTAGADDTVTDAIEAAVADYLAGIAFEQDYVSYGQIAAAILDAEGVLDFENLLVNGGTANVQLGERECPVLGTVTISYAV